MKKAGIAGLFHGPDAANAALKTPRCQTRFGVVGMAGLVDLHHFQNCPAAGIGRRQRGQVLVDMRFDLTLGLHHEPQVPAVAAQAGQCADGKAAGVPHRVEQAGTVVELLQTVGAPRQMVGFLLRGFQQVGARSGIARDRGLAAVKCLRADLAHMVDPHQAGGVAALRLVQHHVGQGFGGVGAHRNRRAQYRFQGALGIVEHAVESGQTTSGIHGASLPLAERFRAGDREN